MNKKADSIEIVDVIAAEANEVVNNLTKAQVTGNDSLVGASVNSAPSFIAVGIVTTDIGDYDDFAYSVILQADGKILVAGESYYDFALVRYNADGSLDTSFDGDGILKTDFSDSYDYGTSVIQQADGKILVAGQSNSQFAVSRYNSDGSLDTSFSGDGKVTTNFDPTYDYVVANSVTVQANGKILVAGTSGNNYSDTNFTLIRYNTDGSLDTDFGVDGIVITNTASTNGRSLDYGSSVTVQTDGKILLAGSSYNYNDRQYDFALLRYNSNGSLDSSFGNDGIVLTDFGANHYEYGYSITTQTDAKILVAGSNEGDFALVRYNSDGSLDTGFDGDGKVTTDLGSFYDSGRSVTIQNDGKILLAGYSYNGSNVDFALVRYNSDGSLDTGFDGDGKVITPVATYDDYGFSVTVQADGKILVAGSTGDFALVRYNSDGSLDSTFGTPINTVAKMAYYYEDGDFPTQLSSGTRIVDAELAAQGHYAGASITLVRHDGANVEDVFSGNGYLHFNGSNAELDGLNIGTVSNGGGTLTITFNSNATQTRVNTVFSTIEYRNTSENPPASVQIDWIFNDGNTGAQGSGGALSAIGSTTVNITPSNDTPVLDTPAPIQYVDTVFDDKFLPATGTLTASDVDSSLFTYGISNGTDNGDGTMTRINAFGRLTVTQATGAYNFIPNDFAFERLNADKSISFAVWVRDDGFRYDTKALVINITQNGITESAGDDTLIGTSGNDVLNGLAGDDTLSGGEGDDILSGGLGDDALNGGDGIDGVREAGDVNFILTDSQLTGLGADTLSGIEWVFLTGGLSDNSLDASGFTGLRTILEGGAGNDTLIGGAAVDWVRARGDVNFTLTDTQLTGLGVDTLVKMDNAELIGGTGNNQLDASGFTGQLVILEGGQGDDTLIGRAGGIDRVRAQGDVNFTLTDSQLTGLGTDTLTSIEQAALIGGLGDNSLDASAFTGSLAVLEGGQGDDTLIGRSAGIDQVRARGNVDFILTDIELTGLGTDTLADVDQAVLIGGGDGNTLDASAFTRGSVYLYGESGDDILKGGTGNDTLIGGFGDDTLIGGAGIDRVQGQGDTDFTLTASQLTGMGTDTLDSIEQAYLIGGPSDNILDASGFTGSLAILEGQAGDDTLIGREGGIDRVRAQGDVNFTLTDSQLTGLGTDTLVDIDQAILIGNSGDNVFDASAFTRGLANLAGGGGNDTLLGGSAGDSLNGGQGDDSLVGGLGKDSLAGGLGADLFKFNSIAETGITNTLRDAIKDFDFSQGDKIDLSAIDADTNAADDQAFTSLTEGNTFSGGFTNPGQLYFDQQAHILYGNNDADSAADFSIQLVGVNSLSMDAFVW